MHAVAGLLSLSAVPSAHEEHVVAPVSRPSVLPGAYFPGPHVMHSVAGLASKSAVPLAQSLHDIDPAAAKVPVSVHIAQAVSALPSLINCTK